jgi:hypothetical protein
MHSDALALLQPSVQDLDLLLKIFSVDDFTVEGEACCRETFNFEILVLGFDLGAVELLDNLNLRKISVTLELLPRNGLSRDFLGRRVAASGVRRRGAPSLVRRRLSHGCAHIYVQSN